MVEHMHERHPEVELDPHNAQPSQAQSLFKMSIHRGYKSALDRQLGEALCIARAGGMDATTVMNKRDEYSRCVVPEMVMSEGWRDKNKSKRSREPNDPKDKEPNPNKRPRRGRSRSRSGHKVQPGDPNPDMYIQTETNQSPTPADQTKPLANPTQPHTHKRPNMEAEKKENKPKKIQKQKPNNQTIKYKDIREASSTPNPDQQTKEKQKQTDIRSIMKKISEKKRKREDDKRKVEQKGKEKKEEQIEQEKENECGKQEETEQTRTSKEKEEQKTKENIHRDSPKHPTRPTSGVTNTIVKQKKIAQKPKFKNKPKANKKLSQAQNNTRTSYFKVTLKEGTMGPVNESKTKDHTNTQRQEDPDGLGQDESTGGSKCDPTRRQSL